MQYDPLKQVLHWIISDREVKSKKITKRIEKTEEIFLSVKFDLSIDKTKIGPFFCLLTFLWTESIFKDSLEWFFRIANAQSGKSGLKSVLLMHLNKAKG